MGQHRIPCGITPSTLFAGQATLDGFRMMLLPFCLVNVEVQLGPRNRADETRWVLAGPDPVSRVYEDDRAAGKTFTAARITEDLRNWTAAGFSTDLLDQWQQRQQDYTRDPTDYGWRVRIYDPTSQQAIFCAPFSMLPIQNINKRQAITTRDALRQVGAIRVKEFIVPHSLRMNFIKQRPVCDIQGIPVKVHPEFEISLVFTVEDGVKRTQ